LFPAKELPVHPAGQAETLEGGDEKKNAQDQAHPLAPAEEERNDQDNAEEASRKNFLGRHMPAAAEHGLVSFLV
jgi:hypothetical protein